jgi:tetratricopeptide (TPR) repeat protein
VRAAAVQQVEWPLAFDTIQAIETYLFVRGVDLVVDVDTLLVHIAQLLGDRPKEVEALRRLAQAHQFTGNVEAEGRALHEALDLAHTVDDPLPLVESLCWVLTFDLHYGGLPSDARSQYEEARTIVRSLDDRAIPERALANLGAAALVLGEFEEARSVTERALDMNLAAGDLWSQVVCLNNLGEIMVGMGDDAAARTYYERSLATLRRHLGGELRNAGVLYDRLGEIELRAGNLELATQYFHEALRQDEPANVTLLLRHYRANLLVVQGEAARQRGDRAEAIHLYQEALAIFEPAPMPYLHDAREYIDFTRARLAMVHQHADADAMAALAQAALTTPRARRRWWPWAR